MIVPAPALVLGALRDQLGLEAEQLPQRVARHAAHLAQHDQWALIISPFAPGKAWKGRKIAQEVLIGNLL